MGKIKKDTDGEEKIRAAERIEILVLVDNYVDLLLPDSPFALRFSTHAGNEIPKGTILAEHGLSLLLSIHCEGKRHFILFDTGYTGICILNNMQMLGIDISDIDTIVISHFHMDHTGGLNSIIDKCKNKITLFAHPLAFIYPRYVELPDKRRIPFPHTLIKHELTKKGVNIIETRQPTPIIDGLSLITGQIERLTDFEKGMPNVLIERDGTTEKDLILDDQALILYVRGKGLVIISGCAHSGIINTINYARKITGIDQIYAVIGGFHLSGPVFEPAIGPTISELKKLGIEVLVPMHCTGWQAVKEMAYEFPSSFILSSVGTRIIL